MGACFRSTSVRTINPAYQAILSDIFQFVPYDEQ
jgi:hypothetical protein